MRAPAGLMAVMAACATQPFIAAPAQAATPPLAPCTAGQLAGYAPSEEEVMAHRRFTLPSIGYPFDTKLPGHWGLSLTLKVDEAGQVACYLMKDDFGKDQPFNDKRRALLEQIKGWRYMPFTQAKQKVAAVLTERISEEETPRQHVRLPEGAPETVRIVLWRMPCLEDCPVYSIDIAGDGHVIYRGNDFVNVLGEHRYEIPRQDVAHLIDQLRSSDLWSLRPRYATTTTGLPTQMLTIKIGSSEHRIEDYGGQMAGMPAAVTDFELEVDKVANSEMWVSFTREALEHLKTEHFNFRSRAGGDLLMRAIAGSHDEGAMLELVSLGPPLDGTLGQDDRLRSPLPTSLLEEALLNGLPDVSDALIAKGALRSGGKLDARKLDGAFRAAIVGGRLAVVQKIWAAGEGTHPALTFPDSPDTRRAAAKRSPVTLLLSPSRNEEHPWEGLQLVKWLETQGCDLKAVSSEGITLLHIAVGAGDIELVRYLLTRGVKDPASQKQAATALQSAQDEEIALLLLQSGASVPAAGEPRKQFQAYAESRHWNRVVSWLQAHGQ